MRLFNLRTPMLYAFALSFGIVFAVVSIFRLWYFALIVSCLLLVSLVVLFCVVKSKRTLRLIRWTVIMFCIGALCVVGYESNFRQNQFATPTEVTMSGYVTDGSSFNDNYINLVLRDCEIYQTSDNKYKLDGKVRTTIFSYSGETQIDIGTKVVLTGIISTSYTVTVTDIDTWSYRNNIKYLLTDSQLIALGKAEPTLSETFRINLYSVLQKTMPDTCDIAYALITGDKSMMSDVDKEAFRQAGIIHVLAVSGLHIGFISSAIAFVLRKLRLPFCVYAPIVLVTIVFYAYLCGFPPSVMRAVVMTLISLIVYRLHGMVDLLISLSCAAIVILLIKPLYLFDAGFLMSFSSVYGICCATQFTRRLMILRDDLPKFVHYIVNSVAVSVGATLGTLPAVAYFYGELPLLGILVNPIVVPVVAVCFVWIFLFAGIPYVNMTLVVPNILLSLISKLCQWITSLSFATLVVSMVVIGTVLLMLWLFILGGYVNIHGKARRYTLIVVALVCIALFVFPASDAVAVESVTIVEYYCNGIAVVTDSKGTAYILGQLSSNGLSDKVVDYLESKAVTKAVFVTTDLTSLGADILLAFADKIPIDVIYTYSSVQNESIQQNFNVLRVYGEIRYDDLVFDTLFNGGIIGLYVEFGDLRFGIIEDSNLQIVGSIANILKRLDWVFCEQNNVENISRISPDTQIVCPFDVSQPNIYGINKYGNFTIK